jgi:hypothetical protein
MIKKFIYPAFALFVLVAGGCAQQPAPVTSTASERVYPYPFETAKIEFSLTGSMEGTRTMYIKGDKESNETHTVQKNGDQEEKIDIKLLELGDLYYQIDLNAKTAIKTTNPLYNDLKNMPQENRMDFLVRAATGNVAAGSTAPLAKNEKEIAGQKCNVYDIQTYGEVCIWNGIPLYSTIKIPTQNIENTTTATKIETGIDVPDSVFTIPADVKIQDTTTPATQTTQP